MYSYEGNGSDGGALLTFHIKALDGKHTWTNKLAETIRGLQSTTSDNTATARDNNALSVSLDGPYGSLSLNICRYKSITLLAGIFHYIHFQHTYTHIYIY